MKLSAVQQAKIRDLSRDPVFGSILDDISKDTTPPRWKPKGDETEKHNRWIYKSGYGDAIDFMVKLLGYEHE